VYGNTDLMASSSGRVLAANLANALEKLAFGKII